MSTNYFLFAVTKRSLTGKFWGFFVAEGDPLNYLTLFKRGTVYLALGKARNALSDLDQVLELKPDFVAARVSRGHVHLKLASYDLAQLDFYNVVSVCFSQIFTARPTSKYSRKQLKWQINCATPRKSLILHTI